MSEEFTTVFPRGNENSAFAQYFIGKSYLNMLRSASATSPLSPAAATTGMYTTPAAAAGRYSSSPADAAGIRSGAVPRVSSTRATS